MNNERCETCRFSRNEGAFYECRRNAPEPLRTEDAIAWASWPTVEEDDWCGQWERKNDE